MILLRCILLVWVFNVLKAKKTDYRNILTDIDDIKDFKKLLRTKTNVLVIFTKTGNTISKADLSLYGEVAENMRGKATVATVDCSDAKKLCKKYKAKPSPTEIKHFKDGEFNKDYDRKHTVKSMLKFLHDPAGDLPWDEDETATDVVHIDSPQELNKYIKREKRPLLVMFYAPWCGYCKRLKPDWASAATEVKKDYILAGMDVDRPEMMSVRSDYNITGFPTIYYFENGKKKFKYGGENNKDGIVNWLKDPHPPREPETETEWSETESDVFHLTDDNFEEFTQKYPSALVMFYAPWCGHCKKMKPDYTDTATKLRQMGIDGVLAAVDATKETKLGKQFKVEGFPTLKYFKNGEFAFDYHERDGDKIIEFMQDPKQPPPPPPEDEKWSDVTDAVHFLTDATFKTFLKKKKHTLVMFYAPWCGHCKAAKPKYTAAAEKFQEDPKVAFAAVDCTVENDACTSHEVSGYPTFKYFNYGKNSQTYSGGREEADFVSFMKDPLNPMANAPPPEPSPEEQWAEADADSNIHHLREVNFDDFVKENPSVLVMFYAPWCGHCKNMKPDYGQAASKLKNMKSVGVLAAVDATVERTLATRFDIKGFPSLKYFKNGEFLKDYTGARITEEMVNFMQSPGDVEPTPPPEARWSDQPTDIHHLTDKTFNSFLSAKDGVLVMFYAPWCGHCKNAKPSYTSAAALTKGDKKAGLFAAVDCTAAGDLCTKLAVKGFPTFKYYVKGKFVSDYSGSRSQEEFVNFIKNPPAAKDEL